MCDNGFIPNSFNKLASTRTRSQCAETFVYLPNAERSPQHISTNLRSNRPPVLSRLTRCGCSITPARGVPFYPFCHERSFKDVCWSHSEAQVFHCLDSFWSHISVGRLPFGDNCVGLSSFSIQRNNLFTYSDAIS